MKGRRDALRTMMLCSVGMALGKLDVLKASNGQLTCDLSQWGSVVFMLHGKRITVPVEEIFRALEEKS